MGKGAVSHGLIIQSIPRSTSRSDAINVPLNLSRADPSGADRQALGWRQHQHDPGGQDGTATVAETRWFETEMAELALKSGS
jgi:hypothetical protein